MNKQGFEQILQQIAQINGTSSQDVRQQMEAAMASALLNPDPTVQQMWKSIPCKGNTPTLDEFMEYLIEQKPFCRKKLPANQAGSFLYFGCAAFGGAS